jgi:N-acetylmuramoyl-L-alanine amidase
MTRDRDTLIALTDRSKMANRWRGSEPAGSPGALHLDSRERAPALSARGFETYFLSEAKTEDARRVAEMENAAQQYETAVHQKLDPLSFIMHDLRQNLYQHESSDWAEMIQRRLAKHIRDRIGA